MRNRQGESEHEWEGWFDWDKFDKEQQFD